MQQVEAGLHLHHTARAGNTPLRAHRGQRSDVEAVKYTDSPTAEIYTHKYTHTHTLQQVMRQLTATKVREAAARAAADPPVVIL